MPHTGEENDQIPSSPKDETWEFSKAMISGYLLVLGLIGLSWGAHLSLPDIPIVHHGFIRSFLNSGWPEWSSFSSVLLCKSGISAERRNRERFLIGVLWVLAIWVVVSQALCFFTGEECSKYELLWSFMLTGFSSGELILRINDNTI